MTIAQTGTFHQSASGVTHEEIIIATVPAGAYLMRVNIEGSVILPTANITYTVPGQATFNQVAGVQYGPTGYTPAPITAGAPGTANWIAYARLMPQTGAHQNTPGVAPQNLVQIVNYTLAMYLPRCMNVPAAIDLTMCIGGSLSVGTTQTFEAFWNAYVSWATFP